MTKHNLRRIHWLACIMLCGAVTVSLTQGAAAAPQPAPVEAETVQPEDAAVSAPASEAVAPVESAAGALAEAPLLDAVKKFLEEDNWYYEQIEGRTVLRMAFKGDNGEWMVLIQTKEDAGQALFYSVLTEKVPAEQRSLAGEYLHRANYGLPMGCFELDFEDGEVRFRTSVDVEDGAPSPAQIKTYLYTNVSTCDWYLPGLKRVLSGAQTPEAAIHEIEGPPGTP